MQRLESAAGRSTGLSVALCLGSSLVLSLSACGDDTAATGSGGGATSTATAAEGGAGGATTASTTTGAGQGGDSGPGGAGGDGGNGEGGAGIGGDAAESSTGAGGAPVGPVIVGGDRPVEVLVPESYDHDTPTPLIILLHGYTASGAIQESYFRFSPLAEELGFLFAAPDGTIDDGGEGFWNATEACCNFYGSDVDDSAYLQGLIDEIAGELTVDPKRVYFVGHSNGGFMSYRMACEHADTVAAIASLAGATYADTSDCSPSEPVTTLQIHGTSDTTILYTGGNFGASDYPGAVETVATWAGYNGCDPSTIDGEARDLSNATAGDETEVTIYDEGCDPHGGAELWTIPGESHIPALSPTFSRQIVEWLLAHPKP